MNETPTPTKQKNHADRQAYRERRRTKQAEERARTEEQRLKEERIAEERREEQRQAEAKAAEIIKEAEQIAEEMKQRAAELTTEEAEMYIKQGVALLTNLTSDQIHLHFVENHEELFEQLKAREKQKNAPLSHDDVNKINPNFVWITEPGLHLAFDKANPTELVLAVRITPWDGFPVETRRNIQDGLQTAMDVTQIQYKINNNASTRRHDSQDPTIKTPGDMYAIGWHNAQEANKTVAAYAQRKVSSANNAEYISGEAERVVGKLPSLAALYRDHLTRIFPGGAQINQEYADANGVLSFGDILDGDHVERPFHNSLTLTLRRFSNFQHQDKDATTVAFGLWWEAVEKNIEGRKRWVFPENGDHEKTRGGGFMWGKFQIGVDFERAKGLVEIYWRGKEDWHGTLESHDEPNYTRFGTSVQITAKGANAMRATWSPRGLAESQHDVARLLAQSRVVTPADRQESNDAHVAKRRKVEASKYT